MSDRGSPSPPFPGPRAALEALRFTFGPPSGPRGVGAWVVYLPLVGLALGALWVATDLVVSWLGSRALSSLAVVAVHLAATRGRPLLALATLVSALTAPRDRSLARLEDPRASVVQIAAAGCALLELALLVALNRFRFVGLVFAPLLGACSIVVLAVGSRAARADGRRVKFAPEVTFREFGIASTATFALVFLSTEFLGLLLILSTAAFAIAARVGCHRRLGGVNDTVLRATGEATQIVALAVLAVFR